MCDLTKFFGESFRYILKHDPVLEELKDTNVNVGSQKKAVWNLLCSNPVHVFQLIRRLKFFEENIDPLLKDTSRKQDFQSTNSLVAEKANYESFKEST